MAEQPAKVIDRLFAVLGSNYGSLWTARFGNDQGMLAIVRRDWATTLAPYSIEQITYAVEVCKRRYDKPPSLTEFAKLCAEKGKFAAPAHKPFELIDAENLLPKPKINREVGREAIAKMREALR